MTGDEMEKMERTMQFILEQQAQFMANIQILQEQRARDEGRSARLERAFVQLTEITVSANERMNEQEARNTERLSRLERAFVQLTELAVSANERMNTHDTRVARIEDVVVMLKGAFAQLTELAVSANERMNEQEARNNGRMNEHGERMNEHNERLARVEEAVVMLTRLVGGEDGKG